ncbi:MAG: alpha/beta hydrolase family protein [Actinomycetota bacterium]
MSKNLPEKQPKTQILNLNSKLLGQKVPYYAIFPADYGESPTNFGVLYLLHGLFGRFDNWITNTKIVEYAKDFPFLIICPDGGDNWYSDNEKVPNFFYESYIFQELIPAIEKNFKVNKSRESRAIAGLSMGGYGAFKFAFRRPEMFCFAASMSGAFHAAGIFDDESNQAWIELFPSIPQIFGNNQEMVRQRNDLFQIVEKFPSKQIKNLPYFYFDCGAEDSFLPVNQRFAELLTHRKIPHQFIKTPGGHDWDYWNNRIKVLLSFVNAGLSR